MWSRIVSILDQSEESALTAIGSEAMTAGLFYAMNYIKKIGNGVESSKTNKGGKYLKKSSMGKTGNVAYDEKGVHLQQVQGIPGGTQITQKV